MADSLPRRPLFWLALLAACCVPYLPFLPLPLVSDDYLQIAYARDYVSPSGWSAFVSDPLYRTRATSLILTCLLDRLFGPDPLAHRLLSLACHFLCAALIVAAGTWRAVGFATSVPAAFFFAVREGHQEAVVWTAALHDQLVTFTATLCLLTLALAIQDQRPRRLPLVFLLFLAALYSKESAAILPVMAALIWLLYARRDGRVLALVCAMAGVAALYTWASLTTTRHHLHLEDGTFSLHAPFALNAARSYLRMLVPWGMPALVVVAWRQWRFASAAVAFSLLALLPYSFLTYMNRVPSRHTYWAAVALALLSGRAWSWLQPESTPRRAAVAAALLVAFSLHNIGYLWTRKLDQYRRRAAPTEEFLAEAGGGPPPVILECAPYRLEVFQQAARIRLRWAPGQVLPPDSPAPARRLCLESKP